MKNNPSRGEILWYLFSITVLFGLGYLVSIQARPLEIPKPEIISLTIEPVMFKEGVYIYKDGARVILRTKNASRKEIWFRARGSQVPDLPQSLLIDFSSSQESRLLLKENFVGQLWAKAYNSQGEKVFSGPINLKYTD